jgi:hypothetical protein
VILIEFLRKISRMRSHATAATPSIDVSGWLQEQLAQTSPDLLRAMVTTFAGALMSAEADAVCGAGYGERSDQRVNTRNGYLRREWDSRAGQFRPGDSEAAAGIVFPRAMVPAAPAMTGSATRVTSLSMSTASSTSAVVTATAMTASGQILSGHGICVDGCPGSSAMRRFQRTGGMQSGRHAGHA